MNWLKQKMEKIKNIFKYSVIITISFFLAGFLSNMIVGFLWGDIPYYEDCFIQTEEDRCLSLLSFLPYPFKSLASAVFHISFFIAIFRWWRNRWILPKEKEILE